MPIQKGFGIFGRVGFDKATIRVWQVKTEIMKSLKLATNIAIGFTKINLGMTRQVRQRHEHFLLPNRSFVDIIAYDGIATGKAMFVA